MFRVPVEERKLDSEKFGEGESMRTCQAIMKDTGAHIEISSEKDQSLTFLISGKNSEVLDARRKILIHFQTQASKQICIPREHHRWILGKKGERLHEIEKNTATKISVPNISEDSDLITISGPKDGIEKAEHEIRTMSDEQSKKSVERVSIPKVFHPFILGPYNENLNRLTEETGARINVPPQSVMKDEIIITGEREATQVARVRIEQIYNDIRSRSTTVSVEVPKAQHKYVIGQRGSTIQEILQITGVSVEMPPTDSDTDTITLRGPHDKLGFGLSTVYEKANSVRTYNLDAPAWIHKHIIGRKGVNIKDLSAEYPSVHVEFNSDKIKIEGPPEQAEKARSQLEKVVADYVSRLTFVDMNVNPKFFKHIIGKAGANINRLKDDLEVTINIDEKEGSNRIHIEGPRDGVARAQKELQEKIDKLENEKEKEIHINRRLFPTLIGAKGENIRITREKYKQVQITFPGPNDQSDIVRLRGPENDVEKCHKHLQSIVKEIEEVSFVAEVPIFKQFHKFIIGKGGANIKKIRDETQTKIDLPAEGDKSEMIIITGKKENVFEARDRIQKIQSELPDVVTQEIQIPSAYYNSIIGSGGKLISAIMDECGGVSIKFPSVESKSDKVLICGPKDDVAKAKAQLLELANERQLSSFTAEVKAKPQHHRFLIGKNGVSINKIRKATNTRIIFPTANDEDKETIIIIGKEDGVKEAKAQLEAIVKNIDNIVESEIAVPPKYHKHFVAKRGEVLYRISDECGGVTISFPKSGVDSDKVTIKGAKECIDAAIQRILEIVDDLEAQVTIEVVIPQRHHRVLMGVRGAKVQRINSEFDVHIKFPDRSTGDDASSQLNGDDGSNDSGAIKACDIIRITGRKEKCEKAKQAIIDLIPITEEISVPFDLHRSIIGQKGKDVRELMKRFDVHIELSPPDQKLDIIKVTGTAANVTDAKEAISKRVEELELDRKDRELRSYEIKIEVDPEFHPKIIGRSGAVINKIRNDHGVQISLPRKGEPEENIITIQGYEHAAQAARDDILKIVGELSELVRESIEVDSRVHPRLIGQRGRSIRKIMDDFKVEIKFPKSGDSNPDLVTIIGSEEAVSDAKDHILNLAEEYMQDVADSVPRNTSNFSTIIEQAMRPNTNGNKAGFVVQGAPWERSNKAPNTASHEDFPDFVLSPPVTTETPMGSAWASVRR